MQIKTTMSLTMKFNNFTLVKMLLSKRQEITSVGEDVETRDSFCTGGEITDWGSHGGKQHLTYLYWY